MSNYSKHRKFLYEEISSDVEQELESESSDEGEKKDTINDIEVEIRRNNNEDNLPISEITADYLYNAAGSEEIEVNNSVTINPFPLVLTPAEEQSINNAKKDLGIKHELDQFQIQSVVALMRNRNVVLISPCGSGKLLVFHLAVHILRKKLEMPSGVGLCLQPLNNILSEKTNNNPPIKTAYLTMTGEAIQAGNASLSNSLDEILSGDIGCLMGHAESFLSDKGNL